MKHHARAQALFLVRVGLSAMTLAFAAALATTTPGCHRSPGPSDTRHAGQAPSATTTPRPIPRTAEACAACNGDWGARGLSTIPTCNCRTGDAGRVCKDGFDCEGACVVSEAPESEVVERSKPPRGFFLGRCSSYVTPQGCVMLIEKGARKAGPVSLEEPPQRLCVD